jgi:hypothetical protein
MSATGATSIATAVAGAFCQERAIFKVIFSRQVMAWPFTAVPGVPQERIGVLREAFMDTMKDKDFLAEAANAGFEIRPVSGADIQRLVLRRTRRGRAKIRSAAAMMPGGRQPVLFEPSRRSSFFAV